MRLPTVTLPPSWAPWWRGLQARERAMLQAGAAVCALALLYLGLAGLAAQREQAQALRDKERRVLWRMQGRAEEWLRLKAAPPLAPLAGAPLHAAAAGLLRRFALPVPLLKPASGDGALLQLNGEVPFEAWLAWLAAAQTELGLVVRRGQIDAGDGPGLVRLQVELAPRGGGK